MAETARQASAPWLSIVGIGEDGLDGIGAAARTAIAGAGFVFGGTRHLKLAAAAIAGEARPWPTPFDTAMDEVLALRGQRVCVLASGDPLWHGVGSTLARRMAPGEFGVFPAPSSFSLAVCRLGWALQDVETISLHGRPLERLRPLLHHGTRILALTSGAGSPAAIGRFLAGLGFGASHVHVLEALGGEAESVRGFRAEAIGDAAFDPLNLVGIEVQAGAQARELPFGGALDDDLFEHDGQITKHDMRALTLAALSPRRGRLLWDIGAGSGSVAIGWMLAHPSMRAVAIEADPTRAARIRRNATALGVPDLVVVEGSAPDALAGLPAPDAVFVGGGGSRPGVIDAAMAALAAGGRLVANAVTLEMEAMLLDLRATHGGALARFAMAQAAPVGGMSGWRPAMPVTRWTWEKPR